MRTKGFILGLCSLFLAMQAGSVRAADTDETKLQQEQQAMDKDVSGTDAQKVDALAKQFGVPQATVQDLRTKGQGWGEISIGLASAQQLFKMDPKTYPTLADAVTKIESMRAAGEGWGKIAKDLGFKLGPVVSAAHRSQNSLHEAMPGAAAGHMDHKEAPGHMDAPVRPDHPMHPDHPDRPGR